MSGENSVFSSNHGWVEADRLQQVISMQTDPGLIYIPDGTRTENIIVTQHNLTLIGASKEKSVIEGKEGQPPITILAPNVKIVNLAVRTEYDVPAISFTHGPGTQAVLQNVNVLESGSHGVFRDNNYRSGANTIIDCEFHDIGKHAIYAPTGSGSQNLIYGNKGEGIDGDFIQWGVDSSMLFNNECKEAPVRLTSNSRQNLVGKNMETELIDEGTNNVVI